MISIKQFLCYYNVKIHGVQSFSGKTSHYHDLDFAIWPPNYFFLLITEKIAVNNYLIKADYLSKFVNKFDTTFKILTLKSINAVTQKIA